MVLFKLKTEGYEDLQPLAFPKMFSIKTNFFDVLLFEV